MNVLIVGASGFVGRHLESTLTQAGCTIIRAQRKASRANDIAIDFKNAISIGDWLPILSDVDVVVNAVGVLRDTSATPMQTIHTDAPKALFDACVQAGVQRVIQISALGDESVLGLAYMKTRRLADAYLQSLPIDWTIFRPSVVYGHDGASAAMFRFLAKWPVVVVPGQGEAQLQPVHIDDLCDGIAQAVWGHASKQVIHAVGPQVMSYREMIACYRAQLGGGQAWVIPMPWPIMQGVAKLAQLFPKSALDCDTLAMLKAGSIADAQAFEQLLNRYLRHPNHFLQEGKA